MLPTRTRTVVADDSEEFFDALAELLHHAAADLADAATVRDLSPEARTVDERMHDLLVSVAPLGSYRFGGSKNTGSIEQRVHRGQLAGQGPDTPGAGSSPTASAADWW